MSIQDWPVSGAKAPPSASGQTNTTRSQPLFAPAPFPLGAGAEKSKTPYREPLPQTDGDGDGSDSDGELEEPGSGGSAELARGSSGQGDGDRHGGSSEDALRRERLCNDLDSICEDLYHLR